MSTTNNRTLWLRLRSKSQETFRSLSRLLQRGREARTGDVDRDAIERLVGQPVGDIGLYTRALRHRSVLRGQTGASPLDSNERLEFLGDAVLGAVVAERLYQAYPDQDEGFLTRTRAKLVNGPALADLARAIGLRPLVLLSQNMDSAQGRDNPTILADAYEAIIGAIYIDLGFEAARAFVFRVIEEHVDLAEVAEQRNNFKSLLLEQVQGEGRGQPAYEVVAEEGPSHDRTFIVDVLVEGEPMGRGRANSKKRAEQQAAQQALDRLRQDPAG